MLKYLINNKTFRIFYFVTKRFLNLFFFKNKIYILSRTACLGNDSIRLAFKNFKVINNQKFRIDYLYDVLRFNKNIKFSLKANRFIYRSDIYELYIQQVFHNWLSNKKPVCIIFDSYSELTDQKFISKNNTQKFFYSNFGDLNNGFDKSYNCDGLIKLEELYKYYLSVFSKLSKHFTEVPIIFIHFPKKLESRVKFQERHNEIKIAINSVKELLNNFHIIEIPESLVNHNENDDFPYHFSEESYTYVSSKIKEIVYNKSVSSC